MAPSHTPLLLGLVRSTLAPTSPFPSLNSRFGCACLSGSPPPPSARLAAAGVRCGSKCKALSGYNAAGHHAQTCVCHSRSAYHRGHEDLLAIWKELSVCAGVPVTVLPAKLLLPVLTCEDRHSDIKWDWQTLRGVVVIGDKQLLHPFVGKGKSTQWGTYQPQKLKEHINCKTRVYQVASIASRTCSLFRSLAPRWAASEPTLLPRVGPSRTGLPRRLSQPGAWTLCLPPRVSIARNSSSSALASSIVTSPASLLLCAGLAALVACRPAHSTTGSTPTSLRPSR
eukprot:216733-Rhodomonas_salina.1